MDLFRSDGVSTTLRKPLYCDRVFYDGLESQIGKPDRVNFYTGNYKIALGIFNLDPSKAFVEVHSNNVVKVYWRIPDNKGTGNYETKIPENLIVVSEPTLSYNGGVLTVNISVKQKPKPESKSDVLFTTKFKS